MPCILYNVSSLVQGMYVAASVNEKCGNFGAKISNIFPCWVGIKLKY